MQRIGIDRLKPGLELAKDLYSFDGQLLLARGTVIESRHLSRLAQLGISYLYILESASVPGGQEAFGKVYEQSLNTVKIFMLEARLGQPLPRNEVLDTVDLLLNQVFDEVNIFKQLRLMKEKDEYLFTHSINVALLGILMARWLKLDEAVIKQVGLAGILHDIGKVLVSPEILEKPGPLTPSEFEEIKKHTVLGYNLASQYDWIPSEVSNAVLMHHERLDGSGYPLGASGESIGYLARMIAVADMYDAITSARVYSPKETPYKAAEVLWRESFGKLDPKAAKVFYDRAASFYVGQRVRLSNGEEGEVIYTNPTWPTRPTVKVDGKFYDLARDRNVTIKEIID